MPSTRISLRRLMELHPAGFSIGAYQRHYVWGRVQPGEPDAALHLTRSLVKAFRNGSELFLQGITAVTDTHELIDGQQRLTFLNLLLRRLGCGDRPLIRYEHREEAQAWLDSGDITDISDKPYEKSQDVYLFKRTLRSIDSVLRETPLDPAAFTAFLLDKVYFLYIGLDSPADSVALYKMMNGSKSQMRAAEVIKADLMRLASDERQPNASDWELNLLSARYAGEWDSWLRWWNRKDVSEYYSGCGAQGIDLMLSLCLSADADNAAAGSPLTYETFRRHIIGADTLPYHTAKHFFGRLRQTQRRFADAYEDTEAYNRIRAILLLQKPEDRRRFLFSYFVDTSIDSADLPRYYKLSFLGMSYDEIALGVSEADRFDDLLASLSMADVYHSEVKRDVFNLLLRLNIDEDIKLGRRFDFSAWTNRSLEHIYSKSKVWHTGSDGRVYDGNDNVLHASAQQLSHDKSFMARSMIRNHDGMQLSEHCIGNLVLLYGQNNAAFGNASFSQKKEMFLRPGDQTVFQSRNLLHSVCVFAGEKWDHRSIVDNYNTIIKNLKIYYGYK